MFAHGDGKIQHQQRKKQRRRERRERGNPEQPLDLPRVVLQKFDDETQIDWINRQW